MSFNIRYGTAKDGEDRWEKRQDLLVETIRAYNPDLLGMQEVLAAQADFLREKLPGYGFCGAGRDDGKRRGELQPDHVSKGPLRPARQRPVVAEPHAGQGRQQGLGRGPAADRHLGEAEGPQGRRRRLMFNTHWDHVGNVARVESGS